MLRVYYMLYEKGYTALISVMVAGAIAVAVSLSLLLLGLSAEQTSSALIQHNQAKALANACAEEALQQIRDNTSFTGSGSLTLGVGNCTYTVTAQVGENRIIDAQGTIGRVTRKVKISVIGILPLILVDSWQEVVDL